MKTTYAPPSESDQSIAEEIFASNYLNTTTTLSQDYIYQKSLKRHQKKIGQEKKAKDLRCLKDQNSEVIKTNGDVQSKIMSTTRKGKTDRYVCHICGKLYMSANGFKYHIKNVHGPPKNFYTCDICHKEYRSGHGVMAHKKWHEIRAAAEALENTNANV